MSFQWKPCSLSRRRIKYWNISVCINPVYTSHASCMAAPSQQECIHIRNRHATMHKHSHFTQVLNVAAEKMCLYIANICNFPLSLVVSTCIHGWLEPQQFSNAILSAVEECYSGVGPEAPFHWEVGYSSWTVRSKENCASSCNTSLERSWFS